jgi:hypothetical protein
LIVAVNFTRRRRVQPPASTAPVQIPGDGFTPGLQAEATAALFVSRDPEVGDEFDRCRDRVPVVPKRVSRWRNALGGQG